MFVCLDALPVQDDCPSANIFSTTRVLGHQHNGERPVGDFAQTQLNINHVPLTGYVPQNINTLAQVPLAGCVPQNINTLAQVPLEGCVPQNINTLAQVPLAGCVPQYTNTLPFLGYCPQYANTVPFNIVPIQEPVMMPPYIPFPVQVPVPLVTFQEPVPRFMPQMFQTQSSLIQFAI